jgi:hypothetical protein
VTMKGGTVSVTGREVVATRLVVAPGHTVGIVYGSKAGGGSGAPAPAGSVGTQVWAASSRASATGTLSALAVSPGVAVMP